MRGLEKKIVLKGTTYHDEVLFLLWLRHFPRKRREDGQNPNTLRNFSSYKIRF
jgi:hypothetical protein